jgi:RNA polymerase sigma factor (sigma-70 family)
MTATDDSLLHRFTKNHDESAFREIVCRYLDLVIATAMRKANGDRMLAEDISQVVFADLARQARTLPSGVMLGGWLHRHTWFITAKTVRGENRRRHRETAAASMNATQTEESPPVSPMAVLLDDGMMALSDSDRQALTMRYLEGRDLKSIGSSLGISDDTAQKRVVRAVDRLKHWLASRGVPAAGAAAIFAAITNPSSAQAATPALVDEVSRRALTLCRAGATGWSGTMAGKLTLLAGAAVAAGLPFYVLGRTTAPSVVAATAAAIRPSSPTPPGATVPVATVVPQNPASAAAGNIADQLIGLTRYAVPDSDGMMEAMRLIRALDPASLPDLARQIASRPIDWRLRGAASTLVLSEWARTAPADAMAMAEGEDTQALVLQHWLRRDKTAALTWLEKQFAAGGTTKATNLMLRCAAEQLAGRQDLTGALALVARLASPENAGPTYNDITRLLTTQEDRIRVYDAISALPDAATRNMALRGFIGSWANAAKDDAREWIESRPPAGRDQLTAAYGSVWMWVDPESTADWWLDLSGDKPAALRGILEHWRADQIDLAGVWLSDRSMGPGADQGVAAFAAQAFIQDPEGALQWSGVITEAPLRDLTAAELYRKWLAIDAPGARRFLSNARMSEKLRAVLTPLAAEQNHSP